MKKSKFIFVRPSYYVLKTFGHSLEFRKKQYAFFLGKQNEETFFELQSQLKRLRKELLVILNTLEKLNMFLTFCGVFPARKIM